jgi:ParB family chromosome partitioning protein
MPKRGGLGKGLAALIPPGSENGRLEEISVDRIRPNPYQPRQHFDEQALNELAESIQTLGLLQPVVVRRTGDIYELIAGERRWRAARRAGLKSIPAVVRESDDTDSLVQALTENLQRESLTPLEEANAYQQLVEDFNLTHEEIAAKVGKSRPAITNALRLLQLPPVVQRLLGEGRLSAGHARALLGVPDRATQERLGVEFAAKGVSVRQAEQRVRALLSAAEPQRQGGSTKAKSSHTPGAGDSQARALAADVEDQLGKKLNAEVRVELSSKGSGRILIRFADVEDLERVAKAICE